jgi:carbon-monoxide dehydrogenase medium subunit
MTSALEPGEILTSIRIPAVPGRAGSAYVKIRNKASHYALAGAAVVLQIGGDGTCSNASIALTGVASKPFRLERAETHPARQHG